MDKIVSNAERLLEDIYIVEKIKFIIGKSPVKKIITAKQEVFFSMVLLLSFSQ